MTQVLLMKLEVAGHAEREATLLPRLHVEEQARYRSFVVEGRRHSWLAGRELLLAAVAQVLGEADPGALLTSASGAVSYRAAPVHLNLSHSGALLAAAASQQPVGIDIERIRPRAIASQADRVFCMVEARSMERLDDSARLERFFQLWTLKEAACKAAELSIWDGLGKACFDLEAGRCRLAPPFPPGPWRLAHGGLDGDWRIAVAIRGDSLEWSCRYGAGSIWDSQAVADVQMLQGE